MREAELWSRLTEQIGDARVRSWAELQALGPLGGRTVREALDDGVSCKTIWRACWEVLELPLKYK